MAVYCPKPIKACAVRATLLDACGAPVDTAIELNSQIVLADFITLSFSPDIETGEEFKQKNACGTYCVNETDCDILNGFDVTLELCGVQPHIMSMLLGGPVFKNAAGDTIGMAVPGATAVGTDSDLCSQKVLLEVWTKNAGGGACDTSGNSLAWQRWFFPQVDNWQYGGETSFSNGIINTTLSGYAKGSSGFDSPVGVANDADLTQAIVDAVRDDLLPMGYVSTASIPTATDCDYVNPS